MHPEFRRIADMPTKADIPVLRLLPEQVKEMMDAQLARDPSAGLYVEQALALLEAAVAGGLLGSMGVGSGKTLTSLLLGVVWNAKRVLVLTKGSLVDQMREEAIDYGRLFKTQPVRVESYDRLSRKSGWETLINYKPDAIVADEGHELRNPASARTKKIWRYFQEYPTTKMAVLSGTLTNGSVADYVHLTALALKENSPTPLERQAITDLCEVVDAGKHPTSSQLARVAPFIELGRIHGNLPPNAQPQELARAGYAWRLKNTPGVVMTTQQSCDASIYITPMTTHVSDEVTAAMQGLEDFWENPEGDEINTGLVANALGQYLALGFYHQVDWGPDGPDEEFLEARAAWNRLVRSKTAYSPRERENVERAWKYCVENEVQDPAFVAWRNLVRQQNTTNEDLYLWAREKAQDVPQFGAWRKWVMTFCNEERVYLDSPLQVFNHFQYHQPNDPTFKKWVEVKDRPLPPSEVVWIDKTIIERFADWALSQKEPHLVWAHNNAVLDELRKYMPVYGAGTSVDTSKAHTCALSIRAHGTGRQLHNWSNQLILQWPASGQAIEQLLGRTHRPKQTADEIQTRYYAADAYQDAVRASLMKAEYQQETLTQRQRVLSATWIKKEITI